MTKTNINFRELKNFKTMVRNNISRLFLMVFVMVALWGLGCDNSVEVELNENQSNLQAKLHSSYNGLSVKDVQSIPHISIREKKDWGFWGHSTIEHDYEEKAINGDKVVIDRATGLMWHQSGTADYINRRHASEWVRNLNQHKYAGYSDWRFPTVEEAASLLTSDKVNDRYIDPVFDGKQEWIWTGDSHDSGNAWSTDFVGGGVLTCNVDDGSYVRPVRSGK
jgi:acyl-CoA hydrolase